MANNRQLKRTALEIEKAEDAVEAMRTERLPQFNLTLLESELLTPLNFQFPEGDVWNLPGDRTYPRAQYRHHHALSAPRLTSFNRPRSLFLNCIGSAWEFRREKLT